MCKEIAKIFLCERQKQCKEKYKEASYLIIKMVQLHIHTHTHTLNNQTKISCLTLTSGEKAINKAFCTVWQPIIKSESGSNGEQKQENSPLRKLKG